jgi:uncharacterized protein (TIGR02677 family)
LWPVPETELLTHADRVRLDALRYTVQPEAAAYVAIMRTFTGGISGLLSDQSAAEVAARLAEMGLDLPVETVDERLSYLVQHGNLARSPRETEARSIKEYLTTRARYQLTQRGELVHRQVEELLGATETAREVSSEMLGGILAGLTTLSRYDPQALAGVSPDELAREITTLFAQFERLVESTRDFYAYLSQALVRFDLDREEFQAFKAALLDYLQRFVDEIALHMPQIADAIVAVDPMVPALVGRANDGQRLLGLDGQQARRARGLDVADWAGLHSWFRGEGGRDSDAAQVRQLATGAMRALLVNLRRIAASAEREVSRYRDLLKLARWFDESDDDRAHALWAAAFGLYPCRHLGYPADTDAAPVPPTASWWRGAVADVPLTLRASGDRLIRGRTGKPADFTEAKAARLAEREAAERRRRAALAEIAGHVGDWSHVRLSDDARGVLLDLYAQALAAAGGRLSAQSAASAESDACIRLVVRRTPGRSTVITSPQGRLELCDLTLAVDVIAGEYEEEVPA